MVKNCKKGPVFENLEKIKVGLSVGKKAGFRRNLDLIFQYDGKK